MLMTPETRAAPARIQRAAARQPDVGSHLYHHVRVGLRLGESDVYVGVNNLFDKQPPLFASGASGTQALDTIPAYYDVFGRTFFAGVHARF
jgi:outer membrane receptor protein involved in Fe transport